ncbi:hypothetical protein A3Q56_06895 [Intoshia linei]|uniref:Uncharacterized protein n=1 Tax=Intoshia linei TaxID=1819745 RepID=A0A177ATS9_9BILA|nr:hypothetical protein A3Q56_06895 [Intoshia linei]
MLSKAELDNWDKHLAEIVLYIRLSPSSRTGLSPLEMIYGQKGQILYG